MQERIEQICSNVLERITPRNRERARIETLAERLEEKVVSTSKKFGIETEVRIEGSVAKDTWLSEKPDIDIFMRMSTAIPRKSLSGISLKIARKATEGSKQIQRFAEHPYLEAIVDDTRINIVPCYKVKPGEWLSATDRTPFHTNYVKKKLKRQMRGEIRLLKKFMTGICVYGAEIKIGGFSGYLCELMILFYGSFVKTLEAFARYSKKTVIDIENHYEGRVDEIELLFGEPLVIVDPVDKSRNVASAVRSEKLFTFVAAARSFLRNPDMKFFYPPETVALSVMELEKEIAKRESAIVFLVFGRVDAVADVFWGQMLKSQRSLHKQVLLNGFNVLRGLPWSNEKNLNVLLLELEQRFISSIENHLGPPLEKKKACEEFLLKHLSRPTTVSGPYIEDGRWVVEIRRRYTDVVLLLRERLNDGGRSVGIAEKISSTIRKGFKILLNEEIVTVYKKNAEFAKFLTEFLSGKPKWLGDF